MAVRRTDLGLAFGCHGLPLFVFAGRLRVLRALVDEEKILHGDVDNTTPAAVARSGRGNFLIVENSGCDERKVPK